MKLYLVSILLAIGMVGCGSLPAVEESRQFRSDMNEIDSQMKLTIKYLDAVSANNRCTSEILRSISAVPDSGPACKAVCPVYVELLKVYDSTPAHLRPKTSDRPEMPERCAIKTIRRTP